MEETAYLIDSQIRLDHIGDHENDRKLVAISDRNSTFIGKPLSTYQEWDGLFWIFFFWAAIR